MDVLKFETRAYAKTILPILNINAIDKKRQIMISKAKECEIAVRALDALSLQTKTPYVQMAITKR